MRDDLYPKVRRRVERRLSGSPRAATLNALAFTIFAGPLALLSLYIRYNDGNPFGSVDGVVYWVCFFWSVILFADAGWLYWRSPTRASWREKRIEEEVSDVGDLVGLSADEMIGLHERLSDELQRGSDAYRRLMLNASANLMLWPGLLLGLWIAQGLVSPWLTSGAALFTLALPFAIVGTLLLGLVLPLRALFASPRRERPDLHAIYGGKRKRDAEPSHEDAAAHLSDVGDDGELMSVSNVENSSRASQDKL